MVKEIELVSCPKIITKEELNLRFTSVKVNMIEEIIKEKSIR